MIRTTITPNNQTVSFDIPVQYVGKQIEVIAFAKDEGFAKEQIAGKKISFTVLHVNNEDRDYKFDRYEANER